MPYRGYTLKELTLVPRPARLPVECWQPIQGGSQRALDFMAKHGIQGVIGGGSAEGGIVHKVMVDFQAAHARIGKHVELGERLAIGFQFYIADSIEQGIREAGKYYEENMKMFGELRLVKALTDEQIAAMRDPKLAVNTKLPRIEDAVRAGGFLTGTPADIIESLKKIEAAYPGLSRVTVTLPLGTPLSVWLEQVERFAKEVMPAFGAGAKVELAAIKAQVAPVGLAPQRRPAHVAACLWQVDPGQMPALPGAGVEEHRRPAQHAVPHIGPAVVAAPVMPAIHRQAVGDPIDPAQAAFGIAVRLHPPGRLAVQRPRQRPLRAIQAMLAATAAPASRYGIRHARTAPTHGAPRPGPRRPAAACAPSGRRPADRPSPAPPARPAPDRPTARVPASGRGCPE